MRILKILHLHLVLHRHLHIRHRHRPPIIPVIPIPALLPSGDAGSVIGRLHIGWRVTGDAVFGRIKLPLHLIADVFALVFLPRLGVDPRIEALDLFS